MTVSSWDAELFVNGRLIGVWTLTAAQPEGIFECRITPDMIENNQLMLQFKIDNPVSPKQAGLNEDSRLLAVGFRSVDISLMAATQDPNKKTLQTGELSR